MNKRKGGRPKIDPATHMQPTSVSLSPEHRIWLIRLGGSKWLRKQIERAINEAAIQSGMAGQSDGQVVQAQPCG